jgi:hypothetical protein
MNDSLIHHAYNTFYNKISGTSLNQWLPERLDVCQELIFNSVATGAIKEVQFEDGQVVDRQWILHHFEYDSFWVFGFLDNFALRPQHILGIRLLGGRAFMKIFSGHSIQDIFVNMVYRCKWYIYQLD